MPEPLGRRRRHGPAIEQHRGGGVSNVVQPDHRHPRRRTVQGERLGVRLGPDRRALGVDRDQAGVGLAAERQVFLGLSRLEGAQPPQHVGRHRQRPRRACGLRRAGHRAVADDHPALSDGDSPASLSTSAHRRPRTSDRRSPASVSSQHAASRSLLIWRGIAPPRRASRWPFRRRRSWAA